MEQKDIQFGKGIKRSPSVAVEDGDLSECVNLIPKNGELVNVKMPRDIGVTLSDGELLLTIHKTAEYTHYITKYGGYVCYRDSTSAGTRTSTGLSSTDVKQIVAVGNALAVIYEQSKLKAMDYLLWDSTEYVSLEDFPQIKAEFKLDGTWYGQSYGSSFNITPITSGEGSGGIYTDVTTTVNLTNYEDKITDWKLKEPGYSLLFSYEMLYTLGLRPTNAYTVKNLTNYYLLVGSTTGGTAQVTNKINPSETFTFKYNLDTTFRVYWENIYPTPVISFSGKGDSEAEEDNVYMVEKTEESFTAMMGDVKDYINIRSYEKNEFVFPFFVRYGFRLFDGSTSHLSDPILMMPNSGITPVIVGTEVKDESTDDKINLAVTVLAYSTNLQIKVTSIENYEKWKDLVTGIVVAITDPVYYINEGEEYSKTKIQGVAKTYKSANLTNYGIIDEEKKILYDDIVDHIEGDYVIIPPSFSEQEYKNNFLNKSVFRKIKEYKWEDLTNFDGWVKVNDSNTNLNALDTLPTISDDYNSMRRIYPSCAFGYNNRLNIANIKESLEKSTFPISPLYYAEWSVEFMCVFYISDRGKTYISASDWFNYYPMMMWIYYNNSKATKCEVYSRKDGVYNKREFPMTSHKFLNGAYYLNIDAAVFDIEASNVTEEEVNNIIKMAESHNVITYENAIYASNASNPFYFGVQGQNLIGTGEIKTVSTSAKALSQGQYGQFPLYAFTADGIWALTVDDEGKYSTSNPLNRDVVENADSVCQIDDAVTYACSQGLKVLQGSEARSISQVMEGYNIDEQKYLKGIEHDELLVADTNTIINMAASCKILYDPAGGRLLHIYPEDAVTKGKHYIYDLNNDAWTTCVDDTSKAKAIVPGYPYSTIQVENKLYQYDNTEDNDTLKNGVLLTREMTFDNPFVMKILADLKMIYTKHNSATKCKIGVFVSNDRVNWTQLTSLRKHAYQWYRFRIQTTMTDLDALTAVTCLTDMRRSNKLR